MSRKIPLQIQITSDASELSTALKIVDKQFSDLSNTSIDVKLKADTTDIVKGYKDIEKFAIAQAEKVAKQLKKATNSGDTEAIAKSRKELDAYLVISRQAGEALKRIEKHAESVSDTLGNIATKNKTKVTKDLESLGSSIKKMFADVKNHDIIDTKNLTRQLQTLNTAIIKAQKDMARNLNNMTEEQIRNTNRAIEAQKKLYESLSEKNMSYAARNATRNEGVKRKTEQIRVWEKINASDDLFASAKQSLSSGKISDIRGSQLKGTIQSLKADSKRLKAEAESLIATGESKNITKAQEKQRLAQSIDSRVSAHTATQKAIRDRKKLYDQSVADEKRTAQATSAARTMVERKEAIARAQIRQASMGGIRGEVLSDAELGKLKKYGDRLQSEENRLKKILSNKKANQQELDEAREHLKQIRDAQNQHNLEMEKIYKKNEANKLAASAKGAKDLDDQAHAEKKKRYMEEYAKLKADPKRIKKMKFQEAQDAMHMLAGVRASMGGDPDVAVGIKELQTALNSRISETRGKGFVNWLKGSVLGIKTKGTSYGNVNSNLFHQANKKVTHVAQMLGTSLYGMGIAGLGSAIVGGGITAAAEKETMKLTLAGMTNQNRQFLDLAGKPVENAKNLERSILHAGKLYEKIRESAKTSLMTTSELAEGFLTGSGRLQDRGFSEDQALDITKKILLLGRTTGLSSTAIMSDIRDFAVGNVTARSQVLQTAGLDKKELIKAKEAGGSAGMYKYFNEKMAAFTDAFAAIANTPAGKINAFKIEIEQLQQTVGEKLIPLLIPQLEKFRDLIYRWVESGEAEKFINSFGQFVNGMSAIIQRLVYMVAPLLSQVDNILIIGFAGMLLRFVGQLGLIGPALSNPITGILLAIGTLVSGIIMYRQMAEDKANAQQENIDKVLSGSNPLYAREKAKDYFNSRLNAGTFDITEVNKKEEYAKNAKKALPLRELLRRLPPNAISSQKDFLQNEFGHLYDNKKTPMSTADMEKARQAARSSMFGGIFSVDETGKTESDIARDMIKSLRQQGYTGKQIAEMAKIAVENRDKRGVADEKYYSQQLEDSYIGTGASYEKEIYTASLAKVNADPKFKGKSEKEKQKEIARLMDIARERSLSKYKGEDDDESKKKGGGGSYTKPHTFEDVLRAYAKARQENLERVFSKTPDTAMEKGIYSKPRMALSAFSSGVNAAVATYKDYLQDNRDKGKYTVGIANAELFGALQKLKDGFFEQIKVIQENIANQKEQNRILKDNIALQQKTNQIEKEKFKLGNLNPNSEEYYRATIKLARMQYNYDIASAQATATAGINKLNIDKMKFATDAEVLKKMTPEQAEVYKAIMGGTTSSTYVPDEILTGNLSDFTTGVSAATSKNAKGTKTLGPKISPEILRKYITDNKNPVTAISKLFSESGVPISPDIAENIALSMGLINEQQLGAVPKASSGFFNTLKEQAMSGFGYFQQRTSFGLNQKLSTMGLSGDELAFQLKQNEYDVKIRDANENAQAYRARMARAYANTGVFLQKYGITSSKFFQGVEAKASSMTDPLEIAKKQNEIEFNRTKAVQEKLAEVYEKVAANLERIAEIDFSRFTEALQNPYGRINAIANPVQMLSTQIQQQMENDMASSEASVSRQQASDIKNNIIRPPGYYESLLRKGRANARQKALTSAKAGMPEAFANQTRNAVGANIFNALATNAYGMLLGGNGVDVAGILSPFMNVMNSKFSQSGDILTALMTGQKLKPKDVQGTFYEQFLKGNVFDRKGARGYATSQMLGRIGGNLAGNYIGGQIFGANANKQAISLGTDLGGMAASSGMLGKAFGGPWGMVAGAVLGSLVGGLFGGKQLSAEEERFRQRQKEHFDRMEKLAEENNKLLRPSYDVYNTIKGDVLYGSSSRWFSSKAYSPLGNQVQLGTR